MRLQRFRLELGMELAPNKMRMVRKLNHLYISPVRSRPGNPQPARRQGLFILAVEFITMPVALADLKLSINFMRQSSRLDFASPSSQPHSPAKFLDAAQFAQLVNHPMRSRRIELARISIRQSANIASKFDASRLHPQTNPKVRDFILPRITNRNQHPLNAALAKPARHQNPIVIRKLLVVVSRLKPLSLDPIQIQFQIMSQSAMHQSLLQRLIAVLVFDVLAYYADCYLGFWVVDAVD